MSEADLLPGIDLIAHVAPKLMNHADPLRYAIVWSSSHPNSLPWVDRPLLMLLTSSAGTASSHKDLYQANEPDAGTSVH